MNRNRFKPGHGWLAIVMMTLSLIVGSFSLTGCATGTKAQLGDVEKVVRERTGHLAQWQGAGANDTEVRATLAPLLGQPLTVSSAVQIALINNRSLRASLQEIGISQAELAQAGLLSNPELGVRPRWPISGHGGNNTEIDLMKDFMDVLALPLRKRVAAQQLEQTKARVAHEALDLVYQLQVAFYTLQGQIQARDMQRKVLEVMDAATDLAQRQRQAGNINELTLLGQEAVFERAKLDLADMELEIQAGREQLNRLMGLWGPESAAWTIAGELAQPPVSELSLEHMETRATQQRMDLAATRSEVELLNQTLILQRRTRWTSIFQFGVDYERELDGTKVVGPHLIVTLPIFDRGQARIAQTRARLEQSQERLTALATDIRSEVREAHGRMMATRAAAQFYRDVLLPKQQRIVALSQTYYNGMQLGVFDLLHAKQSEVTTHRETIEALRDYWIARAKLEGMVGGGILSETSDAAPGLAPQTVKPGSSAMGQMHHH